MKKSWKIGLIISVLIIILSLIIKINFYEQHKMQLIYDGPIVHAIEIFEDPTKKIMIYPQEISIKKGDKGGFGFSIRNDKQTDVNFSYTVSFIDKDLNCKMTDAEIEELLVLGSEGNIQILSESYLDNPILVEFDIPEEASFCKIRYGINVKEGEKIYLPTVNVDLEIK